MMVRASRSQVVASFGAAATIWPSSAMPVRKSFLANAASASRRICATGLVGVPGVGLDLRLERDRAVGEVAVLERLFGGIGGDDDGMRRNDQQRGGKAGANERKHR